jgi:hypothetical protein
MITFLALGNYGRLGNQMFQVAATLAAASRAGAKACFPLGTSVQDAFELPDCEFLKDSRPNFEYVEKSFEFNPEVLLIPSNVNLHGYFQSEKYFLDTEDVVKRNFQFKPEIKEKAAALMSKIGDNICAVHVRRGDYLNLQHVHKAPGNEYYESAIKMISEHSKNTRFLIFSDDIEWCKSSEAFKDCLFSEQADDRVELCMMTLCDSHIIANSSFSWWGARLAKSKMTIAPAAWFGEAGPKNWKDIYCRGWIKI